MKKKLLWLLLSILIIILLVVIFFKFNNIIKQNTDKSLLDGDWFLYKNTVSNGDVIETFDVNNLKLTFLDKTVNICDIGINDCDSVNYTIDNNIVHILEENELFFGEYIFSVENDKLLLKVKNEGSEVIYYFSR